MRYVESSILILCQIGFTGSITVIPNPFWQKWYYYWSHRASPKQYPQTHQQCNNKDPFSSLQWPNKVAYVGVFESANVILLPSWWSESTLCARKPVGQHRRADSSCVSPGVAEGCKAARCYRQTPASGILPNFLPPPHFPECLVQSVNKAVISCTS